MPSNRFEIVERLFQEVSDLPIGRRATFLNNACAADPDLKVEVERLIAALERAESNPGWNAGAMVNEAGYTSLSMDAVQLDRYRLLDRIGSGGMGVVYKAVRADDSFAKTVAIKMVHAAASEAVSVARFLQERQILAQLEHPNITRLLDGGTTHDGQPFLVMEYVEGVTLTKYLQSAGLPTRGILQLFLKICDAVSCAHRSLILHRDLKPSNILVTAQGEPKLLDFGVATLMDGSALQTRTGAAAMTPAYASPEQLLGDPLSTTSDIYSLGVLLCVMLTGALPYKTSNPIELAREITDGTVRPLNSLERKRFDGDLETIVAMALRREAGRRYRSVEQFASDIKRYLEGYPVSARPDTRIYRVGKFVRRNRLAVISAIVILIAVVGGVAATVRQANIANRRFQDVRSLANSYLFEFHDAIKDLPGSTPARHLVVKRALEYLGRLSNERGNDVGLARELAAAYAKTALIQGQASNASLGDRPGAVASFQKAIAILEPIALETKDDTNVGPELAKDYAELGYLLTNMGDIAKGADYSRRAVELGERLVALRPADRTLLEPLASGYQALADVTGNPNYQNLGDTKAALGLYNKALALFKRLADEDPENAEKQNRVATLSGRLGQMYQALDDKAAAVEAYRNALAIAERMYQRAPLNILFEWDAAATNRNLAFSLVRTNRAEEAVKYGDRSMDLFMKYANQDPNNVDAQIALGDSYYLQGFVRASLNDHANAMAFYNRAISTYEIVIEKHPGMNPPPGMRTTYQFLSDLSLKSGDALGSIAFAGKELSIDDRLLAINPSNAGARRNQGLASRQTAQAHQAMGEDARLPAARRKAELREALVWYQRGLDIYLAQKAKGTLVAMYVSEIDSIRGYIAKCEAELAGR